MAVKVSQDQFASIYLFAISLQKPLLFNAKKKLNPNKK